jgi:hypothetical protein
VTVGTNYTSTCEKRTWIRRNIIIFKTGVELLELGQRKPRGQIRMQRFERTSALLYTHISCLVHCSKIRLLAGGGYPIAKDKTYMLAAVRSQITFK